MERLCELHRVRHHDGDAIALFKTNVDYSGVRTTWGCHESYISRRPPAEFIPHLVPHLVSRIAYTGAEEFHPLQPGLPVVLSPRIFHILFSDAPPGAPPLASLTRPIRDAVRQRLRGREPTGADIENFLRVRAELFEIDRLSPAHGAAAHRESGSTSPQSRRRRRRDTTATGG